MFPLMILTAVMWAPLNPSADQAALTGLFRKGVPARVSVETPIQMAVVRDWLGDGCRSNLAVGLSPKKTLRTAIDWAASDRGVIEIKQDGHWVTLSGGYSDLTDINWLQFRFPTAAEADRAVLAFRRLRAACRPQH